MAYLLNPSDHRLLAMTRGKVDTACNALCSQKSEGLCSHVHQMNGVSKLYAYQMTGNACEMTGISHVHQMTSISCMYINGFKSNYIQNFRE